MNTNLDIVRQVVVDWYQLTPQEWAELCCADIRYQNMPWEQVRRTGPAEVHAVLSELAATWDCVVDLHHLGADGDVAFAERTEHYTPKPGNPGAPFDVPVYGIFEFSGGRIAAWRDYFDRRALRA